MGAIVAERTRWLIFAFLAALIVIAVVIALFAGGDETGVFTVTSRLGADDTGDPVDADADTATTSGSTLAETDEQPASPTRPRVQDKPAPPSATPPAADTQPDTAWQEYLDKTREVVETNEAALADAVDAVTAALGNGDADALADMMAPDEGAQGAYAADLASTYPPIISSDPGSNVNVFTDGQATVYIAYVVVRWEDAGIVSEHTIPIMLRFVDGQWRITSLGETGDLQFVQSVTL